MATKDHFGPIFSKYQYNLSARKKSIDWFNKEIQKLGDIDGGKLMKKESQLLTTKIVPGHMYLFVYDPKYKDILPYYDVFPLIFPFSVKGGHMHGLNFHYLHPMVRIKMLNELTVFQSNTLMDERTKMLFSWKLLTKSSKFAPIASCVKQYRLDHVQSRFLQIPASAWTTALLLPTQQFVGANESIVWNETMKKAAKM